MTPWVGWFIMDASYVYLFGSDRGLEATGLRTKTIVHRSAVPLYAAAAVWLVYALLFPLYQVRHFLLAAAVSAAAALIARLFCKDVTEVVELPEEREEVH